MPTRSVNNGGIESGKIFKEENGVSKISTINNICKFTALSSSSSSIGENSDLSENSMAKSGDAEEEVQSSYHKGALDSIEALEEVLPIRRGISSFYNGKSKSYTSLPYATSSLSSIKDIGKPENQYTRKRRNQLSRTLLWEDKNRTNSACSLHKKSKSSTLSGFKCINSSGSSSSSLSSSGSSDTLPSRSALPCGNKISSDLNSIR